MIAKKGPPALRGPSPHPRHVLCNARLADIDAELEQFAMDAGAPQSGLARLMFRINLRISSGTLGLPPRCLNFQRQNDRNPARCQRTTVSGRTMASVFTMPGARQYSPTNTNRSKLLKTDLFGDLRSSTLICCRRTRISASSRALERNGQVSADHSSMRTLSIGHEHHPNRPHSPTV
jgi:hypothetical protein